VFKFPAVERQFSVSSMDRQRGVFLLISFERQSFALFSKVYISLRRASDIE